MSRRDDQERRDMSRRDDQERRHHWLRGTERWYSICSTHYRYNPECPRCTKGNWRSDRAIAVSGFFHKRAYPLWYWWANLRFNKKLLFNDRPPEKRDVQDS